jgi:DtxR family Mn-dependent transcriptional regulator
MSVSTEEYLEAFYALTQDGEIPSTTNLSKKLNVAPASVTEMLRKLADRGLVYYTPHQGVTLTRKGFEIAEKMTRKHRLLEKFLHDVLRIGNTKVHREACDLEHGLSDEAERSLCQTLKAPYQCPDDQKLIPPCNLDLTNCDECQKWGSNNLDSIGKRQKNVIAISKLKENQKGKVAFIRGDIKVLRRLQDMGVTPGVKVSVSRIAPLNGPVEISVRGSKLAIGDEIACNVFVEKAPGE